MAKAKKKEKSFDVTVTVTKVATEVWRVTAASAAEARDKWHAGERRLVSESDVDTIDAEIESVEPTE